MKTIKDEVKKYLQTNTEVEKKINKTKKEQEIMKIIPKKFQKGIEKIEIKNNTIYIKTKTPSWRQEITLFKKEIIEIIPKKVRNYTSSKIIIL